MDTTNEVESKMQTKNTETNNIEPMSVIQAASCLKAASKLLESAWSYDVHNGHEDRTDMINLALKIVEMAKHDLSLIADGMAPHRIL